MRSLTSTIKIMAENELNTLREAISNLTRSVDGLSVRFDERSKSIDKDIKSLSNDVWGTGDGSPGLKVKVQEHSIALLMLKFLTGVLATATVGLLAQIFFGIIKHA